MKAVAFDYIIFAMSYTVDNENIIVYYGRQDLESWMLILDRKAFLNSLVPVNATLIGNSKWGWDSSSSPSSSDSTHNHNYDHNHDRHGYVNVSSFRYVEELTLLL